MLGCSCISFFARLALNHTLNAQIEFAFRFFFFRILTDSSPLSVTLAPNKRHPHYVRLSIERVLFVLVYVCVCVCVGDTTQVLPPSNIQSQQRHSSIHSLWHKQKASHLSPNRKSKIIPFHARQSREFQLNLFGRSASTVADRNRVPNGTKTIFGYNNIVSGDDDSSNKFTKQKRNLKPATDSRRTRYWDFANNLRNHSLVNKLRFISSPTRTQTSATFQLTHSDFSIDFQFRKRSHWYCQQTAGITRLQSKSKSFPLGSPRKGII